MKKNYWKRILPASALCTGVLLIHSVSGTAAYLADGDSAVNIVSVGGVNTSIEEETDIPPEVGPGDTFQKEVRIRNAGPNTCFARVKILFSDSDMEKICTIDWNTTEWQYSAADDFYYYYRPLEPGETTEALMTAVTVSEDAEADQIMDFSIFVYHESYQAEGYEEPDEEGRWDYAAAWEEYEKNRGGQG